MDAILRRNASFAAAGALLEELVRSDVSDICVCSGSRSAPLAVAAARTPGARVWSHVDERSAAFFALGLARARRRPVALVCTSGTAAANFAPAVAEASRGRVPLVVLTADRPPELREWGAGQTVRQVGIYGGHTLWAAEAPLPEADAGLLRHVRALACRAATVAAGPPAGPVHLNLPFREPLHPVAPEDPAARRALAAALAGEAGTGRAGEAPWIEPSAPAGPPGRAHVLRLAERVRRSERGVLVAGPCDTNPRLAQATVRLARAAGWPILPDALSNLRRGVHAKEAPLVASCDALLRSERVAEALAPDAVLRLGDAPTSKATRAWLARHAGAWQGILDPDGAWHDPDFAAAEVFAAAPAPLLEAVAEVLEERGSRERGRVDAGAGHDGEGHDGEGAPGPWLARWLEADRRAREAMERLLAPETAGREPHGAQMRGARMQGEATARPTGLLEPTVVRTLAEVLPEDATLFVSSSLPVRDVDAFLPVGPRRLRLLANRGANGIDGVPSSALGVAAAGGGPVALLAGDLALVHDLGGLLAARRHRLPAVLVVVDNGGGAIFDALPIANYGEKVAYTELFSTPHGLSLERVARLFDLGYARPEDPAALEAALGRALASSPATLVHVPVDREASGAHRRALWEAAARAAEESLA